MELSFPLILDGATGTQLQKRGYTGEDCAERWILEHPQAIVELQQAYIEAGSQIIYAPSFGANRVKLEQHGIFGRVEEYNRELVALSRKAAGGRAYVAGDLAPTGELLYPLGRMSFGELFEVYSEQVQALEKAGADLYVIETMMSLAEARAALLAVKSHSKKPVLVTFTCDERGRTLNGSDICAVLQVIQGMGADAFGLNCSSGPETMLPLLERLRAVARVPLVCKPNAGLPEIVGGETVYDCPPQVFASHAREMAALGVSIFGGCCGTTEEHISALKEALEGISPAPPCPKYLDKLPAATEKELFFLDPAIEPPEPLACDEELEEALLESAELPMVTIAIERPEDLDIFADCQYMICCPLCISCADVGLLDQALALYQGRAIYDGPLGDKELLPLCRRYGLII